MNFYVQAGVRQRNRISEPDIPYGWCIQEFVILQIIRFFFFYFFFLLRVCTNVKRDFINLTTSLSFRLLQHSSL